MSVKDILKVSNVTEELNSLRRKSIKKWHRKFLGFKGKDDVPGWYRDLSEFQKQAVENLFNAIRDDTEQSTSHRVLDCLHTIGLDPEITASQAKFLMLLSRGNDLAFLWFLMEAHYKTIGDDYDTNEQLILSAIAHIDMIPTLRELDRILPPGHPSKIERDRVRQEKKLQFKKKKQKTETRKQHKKCHKSPYLQPYPRFYSSPTKMFLREPEFKVRFGFFEKYKDPSYTLPGEANRWYADYKLNEGRRISRLIILEEVNRIFYDCENVKNIKAKTIMCEYHKKWLLELETQKMKKLVEQRRKCLDKIKMEKPDRKNRHERVLNDLKKSVERIVARRRLPSKNEPGKQKIRVLVLSKENEETVYSFDTDECISQTSSLRYRTQGDDAENIRDTREYRRSEEGYFDNDWTTEHQCESICNISEENSSQIFFHRATESLPYQFDYKQIFDFENLRATQSKTEKIMIQQKIADAFDSDEDEDSTVTMNKLIKSDHKLCRKSIKEKEECFRKKKFNLQNIIEKYMKKTWNDGVREKTIEIERQIKENEKIRERNSQLVQRKSKFYNPEDLVLMTSMLKEAFDMMKENPKFVLASLPDVHKVPLFREWICRRYGKIYTKQERLDAVKISKEMFHVLASSRTLSQINLKDISENNVINFDCHDYLNRKTKYIKKIYMQKLNEETMIKTRLLWMTMRSFLCQNPPNNTFFSYIPACSRNIIRYRPWEKSEFRNFVEARRIVKSKERNSN